MKKTWKVYIFCHNVIWDEMYNNDPDFNRENYTFFKLGHHVLSYNVTKDYPISSEFDFPVHLDTASYAELTGLYCIYKNRLHAGLDYIGFTHYDKEHRLLGHGKDASIKEVEAARIRYEEKQQKGKGPTNITSMIQEIINLPVPVHISLESHDFRKIYNQRVLMDDNQPDVLVGDGVNCIDRMLDDYNIFFDTRYTIDDVAKDGYLNLCDCFVTPVPIFEKLMSFISPIIESGKLDAFDTKRQNRVQGGLMERYVAVFFALEKVEKVNLSTIHQYKKKQPQKPRKWNKFFRHQII
jgi:hypothetical protein